MTDDCIIGNVLKSSGLKTQSWPAETKTQDGLTTVHCVDWFVAELTNGATIPRTPTAIELSDSQKKLRIVQMGELIRIWTEGTGGKAGYRPKILIAMS